MVYPARTRNSRSHPSTWARYLDDFGWAGGVLFRSIGCEEIDRHRRCGNCPDWLHPRNIQSWRGSIDVYFDCFSICGWVRTVTARELIISRVPNCVIRTFCNKTYLFSNIYPIVLYDLSQNLINLISTYFFINKL